LLSLEPDCLKGWLEVALTVYSIPANPLAEDCLHADLYCMCWAYCKGLLCHLVEQIHGTPQIKQQNNPP